MPKRTKGAGRNAVFPTRMDPSLNTMANNWQREGKMTILVGTPVTAAMTILLPCAPFISNLAIR
ncbi:hypothetical protein ACLK1S_23525 [Escherichia coli]